TAPLREQEVGIATLAGLGVRVITSRGNDPWRAMTRCGLLCAKSLACFSQLERRVSTGVEDDEMCGVVRISRELTGDLGELQELIPQLACLRRLQSMGMR